MCVRGNMREGESMGVRVSPGLLLYINWIRGREVSNAWRHAATAESDKNNRPVIILNDVKVLEKANNNIIVFLLVYHHLITGLHTLLAKLQ